MVSLVTPLGAADRVEFNRDIRPLLSDTCFQCHGPDKNKRKAKLRLDLEESGKSVIVPGKPDQSELIRRLTATDEQERMPPMKSGRKLTPQQIELVKRWVVEGAKWQKHWAFEPPRTGSPPAVKDPAWVRNGIDSFILARLQTAGMTPSPEADRVTLIRRVTLDLTGLPPTPAEVDAFINDSSPDAYEKVVDRLLASPRYGERLAIEWLDAARYADSNGYQSDGERFMWRWRDWVIDAFNHNMPFDRFTVEQIAGDLLPNPTLEQRIATGFNRNHRGNAEGGIIPEEYAVEYVVDRVDTTAAVWLGLAFGCARCHDHKYDPFSQKEYYQLFAWFNNVPERGKAIKYGNSPPMIPAPTRAQREKLADVDARLSAAEKAYRDQQETLDAARLAWLANPKQGPMPDWTITEGLKARYEFDAERQTASGVRDGTAAFAPGIRGKAMDLDGKRYLHAGDVGNFGFYDPFSLSAWIFPRGKDGVIVSRMVDSDRADGYSLVLADGKLQLNLVKRWLDDALRMETVKTLEPGRWHHVMATYDGSRVAGGVALYINGIRQELKINLDDLNQSFNTKEPLRVGAGGGPTNRFRGLIDDVRVYDRALTGEEVEIVATPESIDELRAIPGEKRTPAQERKLAAYFLRHLAPEPVRTAWRKWIDTQAERQKLIDSFPTTMVMQEMLKPRETTVLIRGQYDKPGEKVQPGVPSVLSSLAESGKNDRLRLARWLVDPANPLTARVIVNRYWQRYFGIGLVKTTEDFGSQGEAPSHPELLDWLATEYVRDGWDIKSMQRRIVTSATYRQSSRATKELLARDPDNRLLARGPRVRLPAEVVRDQALAASGLLAERLGGPSVKVYQPAGLWEELSGDAYKQDKGEALYRRSLYIFWKRTAPPPGMMTFDGTAREACVVNRARTNTPLQALNLLNDVTYVEAARALAERVLRTSGINAESRIEQVFRLVTARKPRPVELQVLLAGLERHRTHYQRDRAAAENLIRTGESKPDAKLDVAELAAYTAVCSMILNLDEVVTRE